MRNRVLDHALKVRFSGFNTMVSKGCEKKGLPPFKTMVLNRKTRLKTMVLKVSGYTIFFYYLPTFLNKK